MYSIWEAIALNFTSFTPKYMLIKDTFENCDAHFAFPLNLSEFREKMIEPEILVLLKQLIKNFLSGI